MEYANKMALIKWLPSAHAERGNRRGSRGFRYHIEWEDYRISGNHSKIADAWKEAFDRIIGTERCENCRAPVHLAEGYWIHPDGRRICFNDPLDGMATPADVYILAKFADEDVPVAH